MEQKDRLSSGQLALLRKVIDTLFEEGTGQLPEERIVFVLEGLRGWMERVGWQTRLAFRAALFAVQLAPLLFLRKVRRFARLKPPDRTRCLVRLEGSRLGLTVVLLKTVLALHYFEHPEALAATGYDGEGLLGPAWSPDGVSPVARKLPVLGDASVAEGA